MSKDMSDEDMCCELVGLMIEQTVEVFEYTDTCQKLSYIFLHLAYLAIDFSHIIVLHPYMCVYTYVYISPAHFAHRRTWLGMWMPWLPQKWNPSGLCRVTRNDLLSSHDHGFFYV